MVLSFVGHSECCVLMSYCRRGMESLPPAVRTFLHGSLPDLHAPCERQS